MTQAQQQVTDLQLKLSAYFDDEVSERERWEIEQFLAETGDDGEARAELQELGLLRQAIVTSFEAEAAAVPEARFEQIWDEVSRTIDRDSRLQQAADSGASIWSRLRAFMRPVWGPAAVVGGVAAAAFLILGGDQVRDSEANIPAQVASKTAPQGDVEAKDAADGATEKKTVVSPAKAPAPAIARAPAPAEESVVEGVAPFAAPDESAAEIEQIEFGGAGGRIGQLEGAKGTVTVIWVTEEEDPADSERSL